MPVNGYKSAHIEPHSAGDRRPHLVFIQLFTFDFAGFENILGQGLQYGFTAERKTQPLHTPDEPSLSMTYAGKLPRQPFLAPCQFWPILSVVDIVHHFPKLPDDIMPPIRRRNQEQSPHLLRRIRPLFTAQKGAMGSTLIC